MTAIVRLATGGAALRSAWIVPASIVLVAAVMVLSPLTLFAVVVIALTIVAATRDLTGAERRAVLTVLVVAIAIRVALILGLFFTSEPGKIVSFSYDGDGLFEKQRAMWIRNHWLGVPLDPMYLQNAFGGYGWTSYIYVLAYLQLLFGPAPYAVHLVSVWCFVAGAILIHRVVRPWYGPTTSLITLALVLFLPSLVLWSVAAMREAFYFLAMSLCVFGLVRAATDRRLTARAGGVAILIGSLWLVDTIRVGALVIVAAAAAAAMAATFVSRRGWLVLAAAIVIPIAVVRVAEHPPAGLESRILTRARLAALVHRGNVNTEGHSYKLLDERFYWQEPLYRVVETMTWPEAERYLVRAVAAVIVMPFPWQATSRTELAFIPQQMTWYVLLLLAIPGTIRGLRTGVFVTWLFVTLIAVTCVLMAPNEGNLGTMVRHRDTIVPFLSALSALGVVSLLSWAGLWSHVVSKPPVSAHRPTRLEAAAADSALLRVVRSSAACRAVAALLRPTVGYDDGPYSAGQRRPVEDLFEWISASRIGRLVSPVASGAIATWRASALARIGAGLRDELADLAPWQRFRFAGSVSLAALLLAAPFGPAAGHAWPTAIVWSVSLVAVACLTAAARPLGAAWMGRRVHRRLTVWSALETTV